MDEFHIKSTLVKRDPSYENTLRPLQLNEFIGQEEVKKRLHIFLGAAKLRGETLSHALFYGPPGLGKTTLAHILASEMGSSLTISSGPAIEKAGDLAGILTNLKEGDIFFIDEIHRLPRAVEEYLYSAMEDFVIDLLLDSGPNARSVQIKLNRFTLVGATTRLGLLSNPLRSRFGFTCRLDYYSHEMLTQIVSRTASLLKIFLHDDAALEIAKRSRGSPRVCNNLLRWVRDYAQMQSVEKANAALIKNALQLLSIDELGLDEMDKKFLLFMIHQHNGGPVGLKTLATALGEDHVTLSEVHEPYLIMQGLLRRTQRGREATHVAYKHFGINKEELL